MEKYLSKIKKESKLIFFAFFILGLLTLPHYGTNWDAINHLTRGQVYLRYILTGNKDYSGLQETLYATGNQYIHQKYWQDPKSLFLKVTPNESYAKSRSIYQNVNYDYNYFLEKDGYGHPPASDILSSFFNLVLYQKFHIINDIDSYRVYGVLLSAILVGIIYYWVSSKYGKLAGFVSSLTLSTYPLFWAESHFNTEKDIPETVFWGIFIYLFYKGVVNKNIKSLLCSGIILGLAIGTKFNALFLPVVVGPWFLYFIVKNKWYKKPIEFVKNNKLYLLSLLTIPFLGFIVFVFFWPYLWSDFFNKITEVVKFYMEIGITTTFNPRYLGPFNINTYPITWIIYTTYPFILLLSFFGVFKFIKEFKDDKTGFGLLVIMWLFVPIARVTMPGANTYGGVRQIMEFIPPLAILAGVGTKMIIDNVNKDKYEKLISVLIIILFLPLIIKLVKIHPYENAYFNSWIGGLKGAKEKNIPYWGNTFGGAYRSAVVWLNENAEKNARVSYAFELMSNVPTLFFRKDLDVSNTYRSGFLKLGEYAITVSFDGTKERSYYDTYLEKIIKPVFVGEVDGVAVVQVWKNDIEHTRDQYLEEKEANLVKVKVVESGVILDLGKSLSISRVEAQIPKHECDPLSYGWAQVSDDKASWIKLPNILPTDWMISALGEQPVNGRFIHPFTGEIARYIGFNLAPKTSCLHKMYNVKVFYFENIK